MLPRSLRSLLLACLLLASSPSIDAAKRRSRLDLPISKPADAPLEDNLATASGSEPAYERVEAPAAITPAAATSAGASAETESSANASGSGSSENSSQMIDEYSDEECDPDFIAFELVTGYVFSAPNKLLDSMPGTLMLTDCLEACQNNDSCASVNYETGLCVLFSSNSDKLPGALTKSQFPVFTIYAQKSCLKLRPCERAWCIDRVQGYKLNGHVKRTAQVVSRRDCIEMCLGENEFTCR
uniref:Apple domain-containing protein n=3 Tax=Cellia TaxID=44534 RepID=A0A182XVG0_ANOST